MISDDIDILDLGNKSQRISNLTVLVSCNPSSKFLLALNNQNENRSKFTWNYSPFLAEDVAVEAAGAGAGAGAADAVEAAAADAPKDPLVSSTAAPAEADAEADAEEDSEDFALLGSLFYIPKFPFTQQQTQFDCKIWNCPSKLTPKTKYPFRNGLF